jgi:phosphoribosylanthranilate isomerase
MASVGIQIYSRRPSLGEAKALLDLGVSFVAWQVRPDDGPGLVLSRQIADLVGERGARSTLLVHSRKVAVLESVTRMICPDFLLLSSDRDDEAMPMLAQTVGPECGLMMSVPVGFSGSSRRIPSRELAQAYAEYAACLILDTCPDSDNVGRFGCTGKTNDWSVCAEIVSSSPVQVILAGGLTAANVRQAIEVVHPSAVDACTSLELSDKSKDLEACQEFIRQVRSTSSAS